MKTEYIDVDGYWGIAICYGYDLSYKKDEDDIWGYLRSFGMRNKDAQRALNILSNYNTGLCVSNDSVRMSGIFISKATSSSEFWSTAIHEAKHTADAIIDYYGVDWRGEDSAYLTGYITKRMVELLGDPCK
jgi:hypothetical protein